MLSFYQSNFYLLYKLRNNTKIYFYVNNKIDLNS